MNKEITARELVLMALMIALVFISGSIIKVPYFDGFIHIGDCMVFVSVMVLGKKRGAVASSIGMALVDVIGGFYIWAPFTLIIKGVMAYIAGSIIEKINEGNPYVSFKIKYTLGFILGGIFMVFGYFVAGSILAICFTKNTGIIAGIVYSSEAIPGNIVQVIMGIILAIPLSTIILPAKRRIFNK